MWRWGEQPTRLMFAAHPSSATSESHVSLNIPKPGPNYKFVPASANRRELAHWLETVESADARRLGFCGLAGSPKPE